METRLDIRLTQKLIMTPQLQQAIKLLQLSKLELQQVINHALLENPVLEETTGETLGISDEETYKNEAPERESFSDNSDEFAPLDGINLKWGDYLDDDLPEYRDFKHYREGNDDDVPQLEQTLSKPSTLYDHLLWQLNLSSIEPEEKAIGEVIIGNIDENGYLRATIEEIKELTDSSEDKILKVLNIIQSFDPTGVGARDLKECLLIQIEQLGFKNTIIEKIVAHHLYDFEKKRFNLIARKLNISLQDLSHAIKVIERLEPKPGRSFHSGDNVYIVPDVFVIKHEGEYIILLNDEGLPKLRINPLYKKMLRNYQGLGKDEKNYLEDKFRSALWMIKSIEQRNRTIYKVVQSIVRFQEDFLEKGVSYLKPLTLKDVADDIQMHESTVSRVTHNKYVCTPQGIFELKYFFSSGLSTYDGDICSSRSVRDMIAKLIASEDPTKPYTDQQIMEHLRRNNIEIARRTVAKYRKELKIPSANRRRKLII